jgi:hypothetical protein
MANAPTTYKKGSQDIRAQQESYALFWALTKWGTVVTLLIVAVLAYFFT